MGSRNVRLDGIRGIAILLVVIHHASYPVPAHTPLEALAAYGARSAWIGVDLFFVLSGYLITGILLKSRDHPGYFRIFYMRRFFRVFPLYYSFLAGLFLLSLLHAGWPALDWKWNLAYLANVRIAQTGDFAWKPLSHLWSLSVEEQFYLIWPALIFLMPRRNTLATIVGLFCIFAAVRQAAALAGAPFMTVYSVFHLDGLFLGGALAAQERSAHAPRNPAIAWIVLTVSYVVLSVQCLLDGGLDWRTWNGIRLLDYPLVALAGAALIAVSIYSRNDAGINRVLSARPLVELGKYSYAIYLLHYPLDYVFRQYGFHPTDFLGTVLYVVLIGVIAYAAARVTWAFLERPCIGIKDRWFSYESDISGNPTRSLARASL